jgi:hypothetical protein
MTSTSAGRRYGPERPAKKAGNQALAGSVGDFGRRNCPSPRRRRKLTTATRLFSVTVQHEILGSFMWNYQLWTHCQPARIYDDSRPEPLDVYQRLVNANFILNVNRRALMYDFSYLARSVRAKEVMAKFQSELAARQATMDKERHAVWRVEPKVLKVNLKASTPPRPDVGHQRS